MASLGKKSRMCAHEPEMSVSLKNDTLALLRDMLSDPRSVCLRVSLFIGETELVSKSSE